MTKAFNFDKLDAAENLYFARMLEAFLPELYNTKYPELKARQLLPVSYAAGPGAQLITYRAYTLVGIAQAIASYADDAVRADAFGQEFTSKVKDYAIAWGWNVRELQRAAQAEKSGLGPVIGVDVAKAMAARRGAEVNLDNIAFGGDAETGLIGLNNIPNVNTYVVPNGADGFQTWNDGAGHAKTSDEVLADLFAMDSTPLTLTNEVEFATVLLLPPKKYRIAKELRLGAPNDTSVMEYFLKESQTIKRVEPWWKLTGAGAGGVDRMISYRPALDTIRLEIPDEFRTMPPEPRNFEFVVNALMAIGGVICPYPMSVTYGDGL